MNSFNHFFRLHKLEKERFFFVIQLNCLFCFDFCVFQEILGYFIKQVNKSAQRLDSIIIVIAWRKIKFLDLFCKTNDFFIQ